MSKSKAQFLPIAISKSINPLQLKIEVLFKLQIIQEPED